MRAMRMWCGSSSTDLRDGALTTRICCPVMPSGGLITTSALSKPHKRQPDQRGSRGAWLSLHSGPLAPGSDWDALSASIHRRRAPSRTRHLTGTLGTLLTTLPAGSTRVWQSKPDHRAAGELGESRQPGVSIGADQRDISHSALAAQHAS